MFLNGGPFYLGKIRFEEVPCTVVLILRALEVYGNLAQVLLARVC